MNTANWIPDLFHEAGDRGYGDWTLVLALVTRPDLHDLYGQGVRSAL